MEEILWWLAALLIGGTLAFFAAWIALAALARVFAWVLVAWISELVVGVAAGILAGLVLPTRVLLGNSDEQPKIATPAEVVAGNVMGEAPKGHAKNFGWDRAWPVYNPHQAKRDAKAVIAQAKRVVRRAFSWLFDKEPTGAWPAVLLPLFVGFAIGIGVSILAWCIVMGVLGGVVYAAQQVVVLGYRSFDRLVRHRKQAHLRCAKCYRVTVVPSYRCPNFACSTVHRDVRPGPLGILNRRCGCGTRMPATVGSAGKNLATVCPYCEQDVPAGSGTRRVLPIPVIGAVGAGKTQFLASGVDELVRRTQLLSGSLTPISPVADTFLKAAAATVSLGKGVDKTAWEDRPEGVPLVLAHSGMEIEVQLMDAAGENFIDWERSKALGYIDTSDVLVFILDPFSLPAASELLRVENRTGVVAVAQGVPEDSYASVVDRLRAEDIRLSTKRLAIVLTKFDILRTLPGAEGIDPADGESVRTWLGAHGADGFVRRVDQDFKHRSYFAVDSYSVRDGLHPSHPVQVLDWALKSSDPRLSVLPKTAAIRVKETVA